MISYQSFSMVVGIGLGLIILYLVRRDHLHGPYAYWWLLVAAAVILLGIFPETVDIVAGWVGINYAPTLAIVAGIVLILIKMLRMDIDSSHHERRIRRLTQELAILREENERLRRERDTS